MYHCGSFELVRREVQKVFFKSKALKKHFFFKDNSYTSLQFLYKNKKRYAWSGSLVAYIAEGVKYFKVFQGKEGGEVLYKWICKLFETCPALLIVQIFLTKIKILINFKHKHYLNFQIHLICFPPPPGSFLRMCAPTFFKLYKPFVKTFQIRLLRKENSEKNYFPKT